MSKNLPAEIVKALEHGVNKQLNRSIFYSPFRFFYTRFKRNNPQTINHAREIVRDDIKNLLIQIPNFDPQIFLNGEEMSGLGKKLLNRNYNIGIHLLKKHLSVMAAFRVVTNSSFRLETYNFTLSLVQKSVLNLMQSPKLPQNQ